MTNFVYFVFIFEDVIMHIKLILNGPNCHFGHLKHQILALPRARRLSPNHHSLVQIEAIKSMYTLGNRRISIARVML